MARKHTHAPDTSFNKLCLTVAAVVTIGLLAIAGLCLWASQFTHNMVRTELAAQKIYFPPKGSSALDPDEFGDLQQYAGQLVDTGPEAKAYANGYIRRHLDKVAGGKVYAEVSAEVQKDPANTQLQKQKQTLFQGETLRGMLLGNGYGYWLMGSIAQAASYAAGACAVFTGMIMAVYAKRLARSR
jgi:hypothetical protein